MNDELSRAVSAVNPALPAEWAEKLKGYAVDAQSVERGAGQFFSTKGGVLSFGKLPIPNNLMDVIVLASIHENIYYKEKFSGDKITSPDCYAFSATGLNMAPHADAQNKQAEVCDACPHNKWGSGEGGKGKACKEVRRLALMPESALLSPREVEASTVGYLRVPVTSVKNWQSHVQACAVKQLPPFAVVTRVSLRPDPRTMFTVQFEVIRPVSDTSVLAAIVARMEAETKRIDFPYPVAQNAEQPTAAATMAGIGKKKF
jgi:hypothetical protein